MKKLLSTLVLLTLTINFFAENLGYTSGPLLYTSHTAVRAYTNILPHDGKVFYVGTNNKICEYFWNNGTWTGGGQLEWGPHFVKANTQIVNYDFNVFFVNSSDSRIHRLRWTAQTGWTTATLNASSTPVKNGSDMVVHNDRIFYVGTNNKVCEFRTLDNGNTWTGGSALAVGFGTPVNVKANTQLKPHNNKVYYIGTNNLVCEYNWNGLQWTGGQQLDWSGNANSYVRNGSELCVTENDGIFHISSNNNKIYNLKWTSTSGWATYFTNCNHLPSHTIDMVSMDNRVFFVHKSNKKIYEIIANGTTYSNSILNAGMERVNNATQLTLTNNDIYEVGTNNTFKSYQLTYKDVNNRVAYCVYDYLFDPLNQVFSASKSWHPGKLNTNANPVSYYHPVIKYYGKQFFFVDNSWYGNSFLRSVINGNTKPGYTLTWEQNFNTPDPGLTNLRADWNNQMPWGNATRLDPNYCTDSTTCQMSYFNYFDNCEINNGILDLIAKNDTNDFVEWGEYPDANWSLNKFAPCTSTTYYYSTPKLHTYKQNKGGFADLSQGCGADVPDSATFGQQYGYFEIRCKTPRSKYMWPAFWLLPSNDTNGIPEIDIFEIGGEGGAMKYSLYKGYGNPSQDQINEDEIALGYRFYEEYYTYALDLSPASMDFYLNNELIKSFDYATYSAYFPNDPMYIIVGNAVDSMKANSEMKIFPNSLEVDYIRVYSNNSLRLADQNNDIQEELKVEIYPNPSDDEVNFSLVQQNANIRLEVYSLVGKRLVDRVFYNRSLTINKEELGASGLYVYRILKDNVVVKSGKLAIQ